MKKNKKSWNLLARFTNVLQSYFKRWADLTRLIGLETKLAIKTAIQIIISLYFLAFIFTSTWISLLFVLFIYLSQLHFSYLSSSLIIFGLNCFLLLILVIYILSIKRYLYFNSTRRQLSKFNHKDASHEE